MFAHDDLPFAIRAFDRGLCRTLAEDLVATLVGIGFFTSVALLGAWFWNVPIRAVPFGYSCAPSPAHHVEGLAVSAGVAFPFAVLLAFGFSVRWPRRQRRGAAHPFADYPVFKSATVVVCYVVLVSALFYDPCGGELVATLEALGAAAALTAGHSVLFVSMYVLSRLEARHSHPRMLTRSILAIGTLSAGIAISKALGPAHATALDSWAVAWQLSLVPLIVMLPILAVASFDPRKAREHDRHAAERLGAGDWRSRSREWFETLAIDVVRGQIVLMVLVRRHLAYFVILLPASALAARAAVRPGLPDIQQFSGLISFLGWFASSLGWVAPFASGLLLLEETFADAYAIGLRRSVLLLRNHVLILGYGDLGRRVSRELLSKGIVDYTRLYEHIAHSRNILLPSGKLAKVLLRIAAIDVQSNGLVAVTKLRDGHTIGVHDVTDVAVETLRRGRDERGASESRDIRRPPVEIVIPVIVADATSAEAQFFASLQASAFVACTLRGRETPEPSQRVLESLEALHKQGIAVPAVLALHSSAYIHQVTERAVRSSLPVHWILTSQLEGLNAATVVHAALERTKSPAGAMPRVLVCGRGARLFHFVDCLMRALEPRQWSETSPWLSIMTADPQVLDEGGEHGGIPPFKALITRVPKDDWGKSDSFKQGLTFPIRIIKKDNSNYRSLALEVEKNIYDVIVILDHDAETEIRNLNAVFREVYFRATDEMSKEEAGSGAPLVFVSGETGKPFFQAYFRRALSYYAGVWKVAESKAQGTRTTPRQAIDRLGDDIEEKARGAPFVDVLDDVTERILSLAWAYVDRLPGERVVELNFCEPDVPSSIAHRLASLAAREVSPRKAKSYGSVSFTNTRFIPLGGERFIVRSFAQLSDSPGAGSTDFFRMTTVSGHEDTERKRGVDIHEARRLFAALAPAESMGRTKSPDELRDDERRASYLSVLGRFEDRQTGLAAAVSVDALGELFRQDEAPVRALLDQFKDAAEQIVDQTKHCCGMLACPVEAYHKCAEARFRIPAFDTAAKEGYTGERLERAASHQTRHVRQMATRLYVNRVTPPSDVTKSRGLAEFRVDCSQPPVPLPTCFWGRLRRGPVKDRMRRRAPGPAMLAETIAQLLLTGTVPAGRAVMSSLTYLGSSQCHDRRFGVFTAYGRMADELWPESAGGTGLQSGVIDAVTITPHSGLMDEWAAYADDLTEHLGKGQYSNVPVTGSHDGLGARFEIKRKPIAKATTCSCERCRAEAAESARWGVS